MIKNVYLLVWVTWFLKVHVFKKTDFHLKLLLFWFQNKQIKSNDIFKTDVCNV